MSKKQLTDIRELIRQKKYGEARQQLTALSEQGNPTAQKWLKKLDEIAPVKAAKKAKPRKPTKKSKKPTSSFDYSEARIDEIRREKEERQLAEREQVETRRTVGCLLRSCLFMVILGGFLFLMFPMILAAGLTSGSAQTQQVTSQVFTFVEEQQENPVGRAVTTVYTETSGRAMKTVVESNGDEICNVAINRAAANGRNVSREECDRTLREATACVTDEFAQAQRCLRNYTMNRCIEQAGNTPEGRTFCAGFVEENLGPYIQDTP